MCIRKLIKKKQVSVERRTYEKQSTMASPPPFEGLWVSTDAGEVDKIPKQEDRRIADPGCHINPGSEAVPKQRCIDGCVRDGGKGGGSEHPVKEEVWMIKRPFYGGTVPRIVALSELKVEEMFRINDQRSKVTEPQRHGTNKPASADCLYSRHELEETESIRETTAGMAPPEEIDEHQPPGCSISIRNCSDEAVTESPRKGQVVCGSAPGRGPTWLEESIMDSTLLYKISRTHDIEESAVNLVPRDETLPSSSRSCTRTQSLGKFGPCKLVQTRNKSMLSIRVFPNNTNIIQIKVKQC